MSVHGLPWVVGAVLLLLLVLATGEAQPRGYWAPEGYVAQADSLIRAGRLELRCREQDSVVVRFDRDSPERRFFDRSYLRADVRAFNASPDAARSPFVVEGCVLRGVDPFYHRVDLPYNRLPRWRGTVRYTYRPLTATLEGVDGPPLEVRHPVRGTRPDGSRGTLLRLRERSSPEVLADVFFVGETPVLADRRDVGSRGEIRIDGYRVPPGRIVSLRPGDWLQLPGEGRPTWLVEGRDRARIASFVREGEDGRVERHYPASRLRPLLEPFAQAMDLALQSVPEGDDHPVARSGVALTVDRELHDGLEAAVLGRCRRAVRPERPRAVSLLVMDGFTGAVRAMPSCPGEPELAAYEPLTLRTRTRYLRNQNLVDHPIGSAGKPFWTAAVATAFPAFLDLQVPAHAAGPQAQVLGCPLPVPYGDTHGAEDWVGLEEFLRRSCNRYLVDFATAALALGSADESCRTGDLASIEACFAAAGVGSASDAVAEASQLRFCDRIVTAVLSPAVEAVGAGCGNLQLVDAKFGAIRQFAGLTGVRTYREPTPEPGTGVGATLEERYRSGRYRLDAWAPVLDRVVGAGDPADAVRSRLRFSGASPHAANLALNTVEELRRDWINLLLGGENSRWSNFELAEATARLLTGRRVGGVLALAPGEEGIAPRPAQHLEPGVLDDGVRRRVLHAMERVAGPGGTAARLAPAVRGLERRLSGAAEPYDLYLTAKTGTPTVERHVEAGSPEIRRGSVLVLGLLAVPRDRGRELRRRPVEGVSACTLDSGLEAGIRQVPPASELDPAEDVALSMAVYLDDLEPEGTGGAAVSLAVEAFQELADYVVAEVERRLSR